MTTKTFLHFHVLQEIESKTKKAKKILASFTESIFIEYIRIMEGNNGGSRTVVTFFHML